MLNNIYLADYQVEPREAVRKILDHRGITNRELSNRIKIAEQSVSKMLNGSRVLTDGTLVKMSQAIDVPFDTLRYGKDIEQYIKEVSEPKLDYTSNSPKPFWNQSGEGVPYYDVDVFAGDVIALNDQNFEPVSYIKLPGASDCDFSCRVSGNSMATKIFSGAIIICKEIRNKAIIAYGEVHLIATAEQRLVKYVRKHPTKPECIVLRSHNTEYDDIDVMRDEIERLFLVKVIVNQEQM